MDDKNYLEEIFKGLENYLTKRISRRDLLIGLGLGLGGLLAACRPRLEKYITPTPTPTLTPSPTSTPTSTVTPTATPTLTPTPQPITIQPRIEPIKEVRGKIYDLILYSPIDDPSRVREAVLTFDNKTYPMTLVNKNGQDVILAEVRNIKGGKRYPYNIQVIDNQGNEYRRSDETFYIREFENIVSNYLFGVNYMTFWDIPWESSPAGTWEETGTVFQPTLGQYSSDDKIVINRHIDEATGHAIRFFSLDFGWIRPNSPFDEVARKYLLQSELSDSIKFNITYSNDAVVGESWSKGPSALYSDFSFLADHYFNHPSYLKVDGKPSVVLLNIPRYWEEFGTNKTNILFNELKSRYGLFLIADIWPDTNPSFLNDPNLPFDAILNWGNLWTNLGTNRATYEEYADLYTTYWKRWVSLAEEHGLYFIPLILPGFDNKPYANNLGQEYHSITRDLEGFVRLLRVAKEVTTPPLNMIMVFTYNDHHEGTCIEPTKQFGFTYLYALTK